MAIPPPRSLKIGAIIDKTLGVVEHSLVPVLIFVAGLTLINAGATYYTVGLTRPRDGLVVWLGQFAVGIVAAYLLLSAMVRRTGLASRSDGDAFLGYFGLSILYTLGVMAGLILIVLPGLFIMARWSIAQPMLIARGESPIRALGESWDRTRGSEFPILVAALALLVPLIVVIVACGLLFERADPIGIVVGQIATSAISVVTAAMGVALYGMIESWKAAAFSPAG